MTGITGSPPDLRSLPSGCAFHPRCGYAMDACSTQVPELLPIHWEPAEPRRAACLLHTDGFEAPESLSKTPKIGSTL